MLEFVGAYGSVPRCSVCYNGFQHIHEKDGDETSPAILTREARDEKICPVCKSPIEFETTQTIMMRP